MKTRYTLISLAAAFLLSGAVHAGSQADYDKAVAAAQAALKTAFPWATSGATPASC